MRVQIAKLVAWLLACFLTVTHNQEDGKEEGERVWSGAAAAAATHVACARGWLLRQTNFDKKVFFETFLFPYPNKYSTAKRKVLYFFVLYVLQIARVRSKGGWKVTN